MFFFKTRKIFFKNQFCSMRNARILRDWIPASTWSENVISGRFIDFKLISQIWVLRIFRNLKFVILLGHCFELYLTAGGRNGTKNARFVRFAQRRYFLGKKHQKILSFKKVTANLIWENIRLRHSENYAISVGTAQEYFLILTDIVGDCVRNDFDFAVGVFFVEKRSIGIILLR